MEDIKRKAKDDEFNKGKEDIGKAPRKFIPVPKVDKKGDTIEFIFCAMTNINLKN